MTKEISFLAATAASIGFFHTLFGPDHYLPFIVMSKARKWKLRRTILITFLCGLGHVGSSIVIGSIGIAVGIGVSKLEGVEAFRGGIAAWAFIIFGLGYFIYGVIRAQKNRPHKHMHSHGNEVHIHEHTHKEDHDHVHKTNITPWILFTIFILGPCEPLIPILMYPAAQNSIGGVVFISALFAIITIATMLTVVILASYGINLLPFGKLEKYTHALAGAIIFLSGASIVFLGL